MTILQQINTLLKEYIKIPLSSFYKRIITIFVSLLLVVAIATPFSFSKLTSLALLFALVILTSLLALGNYQEQKIVKSLKTFNAKKVKKESLTQEEPEAQSEPIQNDPVKNFIA